jgi:hypothetical protein
VLTVATSAEFQTATCSSANTDRGTGLTLYEYTAHTAGEPFTDPEGSGPGIRYEFLVDRPDDFGVVDTQPPGIPQVPVGEMACGNADGVVTFRYEYFMFRDQGRDFLVRLGTSDTQPVPEWDLGLQILNTLRVTAPEAPVTTTTTPEATTTTADVVAPTTTTTPATDATPSATDEEAIRALFGAWMGGPHTDDQVRALIEDGDSILDAIRAGWAQHSTADLAKYSGRADTIQMIDADHATVQYTLLWNGQSQFGQRTGAAIRTNGTWQVSRDTECQLLTLGGITCPPRT